MERYHIILRKCCHVAAWKVDITLFFISYKEDCFKEYSRNRGASIVKGIYSSNKLG